MVTLVHCKVHFFPIFVVFLFSLSVAEILDVLESDEVEYVRDIFIEPPDVAEHTDEDSADEDGGGMMENLNGRQLHAPAIFSQSLVAEQEFSEDSSDDENITIEPQRKKQKVIYTWKKDDLPDLESPVFISSLRYDYKDFTCIDFFEIFFDDELFNFFIQKSTEYALFLNCPDPKIKIDEMKCFFAILIVSGYCNLPSKKSYWDSSNDMRNHLVYNAMRRDRFIQIMRFIHAADNNTLNKEDKMSKLRPLMNILKRKYLDHIPMEQHMNYDESMIEYFGRHGCKQCIRNKPIRFGYKCWCLNTSSGYLANFEIYQGCIPGSNLQNEKEFGKATAPMLSMIEELPECIKNQKLQFYFDNLFTGIPLLVHLKSKGYGGTGTLRQNRLPKECPIGKVEVMKKRARGSYEYATQGDVVVVRWMDNSVVTVASTDYKVNPVGNADRYSRVHKKKVKVPRPHLIGVYNQHMGGTDLMDAHINNYRIGIRGKKWWWPIFTWLIDATINNAWILMRKNGRQIPQLDFRRELAQTYLQKYQNPPKAGGRPSTGKSGGRTVSGVRFDGINHFPKSQEKRRRCAGDDCKTVGRVICVKCDVGLCLNCFEDYHKK